MPVPKKDLVVTFERYEDSRSSDGGIRTACDPLPITVNAAIVVVNHELAIGGDVRMVPGRITDETPGYLSDSFPPVYGAFVFEYDGTTYSLVLGNPGVDPISDDAGLSAKVADTCASGHFMPTTDQPAQDGDQNEDEHRKID